MRSIHLDAGRHEIALVYTAADAGEIRLDAVTLSAGPSPSETSVRSLLMNGWGGLVAGWHASKLYPADSGGFGPRMAMLHSNIDWPTNQIDEAQAFFKDETAGIAYDDPNQFETRAYFGASDAAHYGELHMEYGPYGGKPLSVAIERRQSAPPGGEMRGFGYVAT